MCNVVCLSPSSCLSHSSVWRFTAEHQASAGEGGSDMDLLRLSRIDEELDSSEAAALCFLCLDVVRRKRLEGVRTERKD